MNMSLMFTAWEVSNLDTSNVANELQSWNIPAMSVTLDMAKPETSNEVSELHLANIRHVPNLECEFGLVGSSPRILEVSNPDTSSVVKELQPSNIAPIP